ncbi:sugar ABC transporter substrate-binding protein [Cohnella xylanilytica]|uniref:Sugar ABC transporter substrate-binding protein n=1 Tax=Cohnella xylanilytica TaxID=557555 RepID=A0A841TT81_9BACL|nr:sugar ABC transporter substrate-binding protein [Cohnella xylanilytica]MBB6691496.1 sugar ABC transporter substrate-binding protein [Cohnella xylanilytica]GIO12939.1 sugar ABC transporter substrate-binding protein [Cohnella xylanilytica]
MRGKGKWATVPLGAAVLTAMTATGCSGGGGGSGGEKVTITHYTIDSPDRTFVEKLIPDFEKAHPNIKVKVTKAPYEQFDSKLQSAIAAKNAPDVTSHWGYGGFMEYYNKGMLMDLTPYLEEGGFKASDYNIPDSVMDIYKVDGKTYGIPLNSYVTVMLYNKDLFDKAKLEYPPTDYEDKSWTFDKMVDYAKKMTVDSTNLAEAQYGVDFGWGERDQRPQYFGANVYSEDTWTNGGKPTEINLSKPETIDAYKKIYGLIWDQKVSPTAAFSKSVSGQFGDPFLSGKIGMSVVGSWSLASAKDFSFNVGVAAVPQGPNEKVRSVLYVDPLFVLKDSKHPKEALEWIKYLITTEVQEKSIELSGGNPPVNQKAAEKYYSNFEGIDPEQIKQVYEGAFKYGFESYNHLISNYSQINELFINELAPVENGDKKAEEVLPVIEEKLKKLLQRVNE